MGWADCGIDSEGRGIGYTHEATCDHPGCEVEIHRGVSFACGGMHGADEVSCERYFCEDHKENFVIHRSGECRVCDECAAALLKSENFVDDGDGAIVYLLDSDEFEADESISVALSTRPRKPTCGWQWAKCNDCGTTWRETSRDILSPSHVDCPKHCDHGGDTHVWKTESADLPRDRSGNLLKYITEVFADDDPEGMEPVPQIQEM